MQKSTPIKLSTTHNSTNHAHTNQNPHNHSSKCDLRIERFCTADIVRNDDDSALCCSAYVKC